LPSQDKHQLLRLYEVAMRNYSAAVAALDGELSHVDFQAALERAKQTRMACEKYRAMLEEIDREANFRAAGQGED
jgi:hypothetical protein